MTDTQPDEIIRMQICVYDDNKIEVLRVSESISNGLFKFILDKTIIGNFGLVDAPSKLKDNRGNINCDVMFLKYLESRATLGDTVRVMMYGIKTEILQSDFTQYYFDFQHVLLCNDFLTDYYVNRKSEDYKNIREIEITYCGIANKYFTDREQMCDHVKYLQYENDKWTMLADENDPVYYEEINQAIDTLFGTDTATPAAAPDITATPAAAPTATPAAAPDTQPSLTGGDDRTFTRKNNVVRRKMTFKRTN